MESAIVSPEAGRFAVQVGAFADRAAAGELVASLRRERVQAYVFEAAESAAAPFRVRVGPFATREEASRHAVRLKEQRRLPTWVVSEGSP